MYVLRENHTAWINKPVNITQVKISWDFFKGSVAQNNIHMCPVCSGNCTILVQEHVEWEVLLRRWEADKKFPVSRRGDKADQIVHSSGNTSSINTKAIWFLSSSPSLFQPPRTRLAVTQCRLCSLRNHLSQRHPGHSNPPYPSFHAKLSPSF